MLHQSNPITLDHDVYYQIPRPYQQQQRTTHNTQKQTERPILVKWASKSDCVSSILVVRGDLGMWITLIGGCRGSWGHHGCVVVETDDDAKRDSGKR